MWIGDGLPNVERASERQVQMAYEQAEAHIEEIKISEESFLRANIPAFVKRVYPDDPSPSDEEIQDRGFSRAIVMADLEKNRKAKLRFLTREGEHKDKHGVILESLLMELFDKKGTAQWLGDKRYIFGEVHKTADRDDYGNGIDFFVVYDRTDAEDDPSSYPLIVRDNSGNEVKLRRKVKRFWTLGIDATCSDTSMKEKLTEIYSGSKDKPGGLAKGVMSQIDYFIDDEDLPAGPEKQVPRLVICIDHTQVEQLMILRKKIEGGYAKQEELDNNAIQKEVLAQIYIQLRFFVEILEEPYPELASIYQKQLELFVAGNDISDLEGAFELDPFIIDEDRDNDIYERLQSIFKKFGENTRKMYIHLRSLRRQTIKREPGF